LRALDGLRGVAALVVVVHHSLLVLPPFSDVTVLHSPPPAGLRWFVNTPLHIAWAGGEAVLVFFVLSGFVLVKGVSSRQFSWRAYFPSRLVRLYLPVFGAIILAVLLAVVVPRSFDPAASGWMLEHANPLDVKNILESAALVQPSTAVNSPLWSLRWEVIFSLLLPLYVWLAARVRAVILLPAVAVAVGLGSVGMAAWSSGRVMDFLAAALAYLPVFLIGALLFSWWQRTKGQVAVPRWVTPAILTCGLTLTFLPWELGSSLYAPESVLTYPVVVAGASAWVVLALVSPAAQRVLEARPIQFLGRVSFSLYLVHEPIAVSIGLLLPAPLRGLTLVVALPVSLLVGWGFYKAVEGPAHRLSQAIRRRTAAAIAADAAKADASRSA
jgi:peptidoglycan/LPS O-acetylase OafA/YrhL